MTNTISNSINAIRARIDAVNAARKAAGHLENGKLADVSARLAKAASLAEEGKIAGAGVDTAAFAAGVASVKLSDAIREFDSSRAWGYSSNEEIDVLVAINKDLKAALEA